MNVQPLTKYSCDGNKWKSLSTQSREYEECGSIFHSNNYIFGGNCWAAVAEGKAN